MSHRSPVALLLFMALVSGSAAAAGKAQVVDTPTPVETADEARKVADRYLAALTGKGPDSGRDLLLGGATMTARMVDLQTAVVSRRDAHRHESGQLADLQARMKALDGAGRKQLAALLGKGKGSDELEMTELSADQARALMAPTKAAAKAFTEAHPVAAYVARVDKEVFWHPKNPFRTLLAQLGAKGPYTLDFDLFWIETREGLTADSPTRTWPLRVVRLQAGSFDTGLRVLPASEWNAE